MLETVAGAATHQPDVVELRMSVDDEVAVDAVGSRAHARFDQRLTPQQRKLGLDELARPLDLGRRRDAIIVVWIERSEAPVRRDLESTAIDIRKPVGASGREGRTIREGQPTVIGRRAEEKHDTSVDLELVREDLREDLRVPWSAREDETLGREALAGRERDRLQSTTGTGTGLRSGPDDLSALGMKGVGDRQAALARLEHAGAGHGEAELDAVEVELRVPPHQIVALDDLVLDPEPVEHILGGLEVAGPARTERHLTRIKEQASAPLDLPRLPASERLDRPT